MPPSAHPAPRTFTAVLVAAVVVLVANVLLFGSLPGLLFPALLAALSMSALFGSRRAAVALKWLLYVLSISALFVLLAGPVSALGVARTVFVSALLFAVARYVGTSKAVAEFYASRTNPPSVGG